MTSAETSCMEPPSPKKIGLGVEGVSRKPSFKCGGPGKGSGPRANRRSATSVQALTKKFDKLSEHVQGKRINQRVVISKPKKFAKPEISKSAAKPYKDVNLEDLKAIKNHLSPDNGPLDTNIYEKPCLPVKTAIGIFENAKVRKNEKPIAAVKPILKKTEEKQKPKLAPKDSLCRVRYNVMRRARGKDEESDTESSNNRVSEEESQKLINEIPLKEKLIEAETEVQNIINKDEDEPKEKRYCFPGNEEKVTVELRRKISAESFKVLKQQLDHYNIEITQTEQQEKDLAAERFKRLNDVLNKISHSTIDPSKYGRKVEKIIQEVPKDQPKLIENENSVVNPLFAQISQSQITTQQFHSKERRFVSLLKKEIDVNLIPVTNVSGNSSQNEVEENMIKSKEISMTVLEGKYGNDKPQSHEIPKMAENLKPNSSFLWSKSSPEPGLKSPSDKPLPKPPESFMPDCYYNRIDKETSLKSEDDNEYDDISTRDDNYDDVANLNNRNRNESLYCISELLESSNIYEDIQSLKTNRKSEGYDEVGSQVYDDTPYESIYGGHSENSDESVKSSFEKNNSLYESAQQLLANDCGDSHSEAETNSDYQTAGHLGGSDTSNSDEWVEVSEDSEPEVNLYLVNWKNKRQKHVSKPRVNWSELQKRTNQKSAQEELVGSIDDHVYESIPLSDNHPDTMASTDDLADDASCIDDFSSDDDCPDAQLPAEPVVQYNIAKSLRSAGKRLLTFNKSDFSRSLKKLRPKLRNDMYNGNPETEATRRRGSKFYCDVGGLAKGQRPAGPPPPPPDASLTPAAAPGSVQYADVRVNGTELYAECGLFKQKNRSRNGSRSSWYTEIGLYGTNGKPIGSETKTKPMFTDEPLYQFYTECVNAQARDDIILHYDSDGYDEINNFYSLINDKMRTLDVKVPIPKLDDFSTEPDRAVRSFQTQNRTLWCEVCPTHSFQVPEVEKSCIVVTLTDQQRKLQEAKFEILTSEGSYIHSLTVLETHFMPRLTELISGREHRLLFSNILAVKAVSERLLSALEVCWKENIMLIGICDVVKRHAEEDFQVYVKFCKHHSAVYRTLSTLIDTNPAFAAALKQLESSHVCQSLSLHSFLMLPMQRITRLPLLLGGVLTRLDKTDQEYSQCKTAFELLNKIVKECDDEARRMDKCEEMLVLSQQLVFPKAVRRVPVISNNRCLVKRGTATLLLSKDDGKLTFGRRISKVSVELLLFTDLLVLAREKGNSLLVVDYCPRNLVQLEPNPSALHKNQLLLTLLENHENKTAEMMVSFGRESDLSRWIDAVAPVRSENPHESVYESWDCPQVIAIHQFAARQPDELSLCVGDVANVLKKIPDGWYQGERLRDGARGWFPSNYTQEISSAHVRAKNKKQRYKLLALSGSYIQQGKLNSPS